MGDTNQVLPEARSSSLFTSAYAAQTRQLLDVVDHIRHVAGKLQLELPRIVMIGNQSAGKSSTVEAIAGVRLPRAISTCTRCPIELQLRRSNKPWECKISLRYDYDEDGERTKSLSLTFGKPFHNPDEVELWLRRAQLAILNTEHPPSVYEDIDPKTLEEREPKLQFSKNVICLEVSGKDITDLTFVDLPGIIQVDTSGLGLVTLIKDMVHEYIAEPSSLILVTITMKDDPENQQALSEARAVDPNGQRTIGVLTKPDTMEARHESMWLPILRNEGKYHLRLGYYVTKQPDLEQSEQGMTFEAARQSETQFFNTTPVWNNLASDLRNRMGTPRLTSALSRLLSARIRDTLPRILANIQERVTEINMRRQHLGPGPSNNPIGDTLKLCDEFIAKVRACTEGAPGAEKLVQDNWSDFKAFKKEVRNTAPLFLPYTEEELEWNRDYSEPDFIKEGIEHSQGGRVWNLDEVQLHIEKAKTRELPLNVPYRAKTCLMLLPISEWKDLVNECFGSVHPQTKAIVDVLAREVFGQFDQGDLLSKVGDIVSIVMGELADTAKHILDVLIDMESQRAYTQNEEYLMKLRERLLAHYRGKRWNRTKAAPDGLFAPPSPPMVPWHNGKSQQPPSQEAVVQNILNDFLLIGYPGVTEEDFPRLRPGDKFEQELEVIAEARAYFQIAYKRIIDTIPQAIDHVFVTPVADRLQEALITGLEINSHDAFERCQEYLSESVDKAAYRDELDSNLALLDDAKKALKKILQTLH